MLNDRKNDLRVCKIGSLRLALEWQKQLLAFVDAVDVEDLGIGLRDARPCCGATVLGLRDLRQRVALLNSNFRVRFNMLQSRSFRWHDDLRAGGETHGVHDTGVVRQQFLPARAAAEIFLRELPQGVTRLHGECVQRGRNSPDTGQRYDPGSRYNGRGWSDPCGRRRGRGRVSCKRIHAVQGRWAGNCRSDYNVGLGRLEIWMRRRKARARRRRFCNWDNR